MSSTPHLCAVFERESNRLRFLTHDGQVSNTVPQGAKVRMDHAAAAPYDLKYMEVVETTEVVSLPVTAIIPSPLISRLPRGAVQALSASLGFTHTDSLPEQLTVATRLELRTGVLKSFQFFLGGKELVISFPFSQLMGLEERSAGPPTALVNMKINPSSITFLNNKAVTVYRPITEWFRTSLSTPGVDHVWGQKAGTYVR